MTAFTRREFGTIVIAGVPFAAFARSARLFAASPVAFGVSTFSFNSFPRVTGEDNVDDVIRALKAVGATNIELAMTSVEPAAPSTAPTMGGSPAYPQLIIFTPQQIAAMNAAARRSLRTWRTEVDPSVFADVRRKFAEAGIAIHAAALTYDDACTNDEIDATFRQAKLLGVPTLSSSMSMAMAKRLVPFAERHGVTVAIHNEVDNNHDGTIATADLDAALALSPAFKLRLDIGNLAASNCDAVAELRSHLPRVSYVVVRDRLRNGGVSQHFGEGDTPIAGVLNVIATSGSAIPALVEYDYAGVASPVDEVMSALAFVNRVAK